MKAYVIKNKEGKYLGKYSFDNENVISNARVFEFSFTAKELCPKDCTIAPITICEGDLEEENKQLQQELAEKDKELQKEKDALNWYQKDYAKQMNELAKELVEKDKEIEGWKEAYYEKLTEARQQLKDQHHQIYEKIRDAILQEKLNVEYSDNPNIRLINEIICEQFAKDKKSFVALIDHIEKGE